MVYYPINMKKLILIFALILSITICFGQNRSGKVSNGRTNLDFPINFTAADTIDASETYWVLVDSRQNYAQIPSVAITMATVSGSPSVAVSLEGKASTLDEYTEIVSASTWTSSANNPISLVASTGVKYRYFKIKFVASGATQKSKVTGLTFTTTYQNLSVISATTGAFSSNVTVGGTLGITGATTATGLITANGGVTLGAGDDLIGSSTSDITINTDKFTVAGATGNTVIAGSLVTSGTIDNVVVNSAAGGDKGLNESITQIAGTALTGNLIGAGIVATNGTTTAPTGVIYGIEAKARAANSSNEGGAVTGRLTGVYASVDAKTKEATTMRAFEASLDGGAGGTSTEAVAFEAFNNSSAAQTSSYAFSVNGGTASGHKAYTADLRLQNGALINNSSTSLLTITEANVDVDGALTASSFTSDGAVKLLNDQILTLGTTTTNAETKITLGFDETTSGIGYFKLGDLSNPQVLNANPGAAVAGSIVNVNHTLGAGDCDDLIGSYSKVNVIGDGDSGITIVGDAPRAYVGLTGGANNSVADEAYGSQPWARHQGTGAITAMSGLSAKIDVGADNFTASTINAAHLHIDGASTVTGQFDGMMVEVYPTVASLDNAIKVAVDAGATVQTGLALSGTFASSDIQVSSGAKIFTGTAANGNAVYAEVGDKDATGSIYISTVGALYIQVANAGAESDWYKVTATNAD